MTICGALKPNGNLCQREADEDATDGLCRYHSQTPIVREKLRAQSRAGGIARMKKPRRKPEELGELYRPITTYDDLIEDISQNLANAKTLSLNPRSVTAVNAIHVTLERLMARKVEAQTSWRIQLIAAIAGGKVDYPAVREEFGQSLADELFSLAGVKIEQEREP